MTGRLSDEIRLRHILEAIQNIENFSSDKLKEDIFQNLMYRYSIERQLEIIGEAANGLSEDFKTKFPYIPWQKIISFRHFIVHEYFGLDLELIWGIIVNNIPVLKKDVIKILADFPEQ